MAGRRGAGVAERLALSAASPARFAIRSGRSAAGTSALGADFASYSFGR